MESFKFVLADKFEKPSSFLEKLQKTKKKIMSVPKNEYGNYIWNTVDPDTFLDFLEQYHEGKWITNQWEEIEVYLSLHGQRCSPSMKVDLSQCACSADDKNCFRKYILYQWNQLLRGKDEIRCSYFMYLKLHGKKTRNVSCQTEVSLDSNKKYYGPKVL